MIKTQPGQSRARTPTVEIAIRGEGALVIRFIDKSGQTLLQERLTVSGSPKIEARRIVELSLETTTGRALVAPGTGAAIQCEAARHLRWRDARSICAPALPGYWLRGEDRAECGRWRSAAAYPGSRP